MFRVTMAAAVNEECTLLNNISDDEYTVIDKPVGDSSPNAMPMAPDSRLARTQHYARESGMSSLWY